MLTKEAERNYYHDNYIKYVDSTGAIMAWDVLILIYLPILVLSVHKFTKKINMGIVGFYLCLIWLPRWISSLVFLGGNPELNTAMKDSLPYYKNQ